MSRIRAYIKPFDDNGNYQADWINISDDVLANSMSAVSKSLDLSTFDIGIFRSANGTLQVRNDHGRYNDIEDPESIFKFKRSDSQFRLTYDRANYDYHPDCGLLPHQIWPTNEVDVFKGLIVGDSSTQSIRKHSSKFQVLGREVVFDREDVPFASINDGDKVSDIIKVILNQTLITTLMTFDATKIVPANDVVVDSVSSFENKTVKSVLNRLLLISNSVFYVDVDTMVVSSRDEGSAVDFTFFGQATSAAPENIIDISNARNGLNRVKNYFTWKDTTLLERELGTIALHGIRSKEINEEAITTGATRTAILEALRDEFGALKDELDITTPLTYDVSDLDLLSKVNLDYPRPLVAANNYPYYGSAKYNQGIYANELSQFRRLISQEYKIIKWAIDLRKETGTFTLRRT